MRVVVRKRILILLLFQMGCVVNPIYTSADYQLDRQVQKYPDNEDHIRRYQQDFKSYQNYKNITENAGDLYKVISIKDSSWYFGHPEGFFGLGNVQYHYLHKIYLTLVCGENSFFVPKFSNGNINWKLDEKNFGDATTNLFGEFSIAVKSQSYEKFEKINLTTSKKRYEASLNGALIIKIDQDECAQ